MRTLILMALLVGSVSGCSRSIAAGAYAEQVAAPLSGYTCFVIRDGGGAAVGGNCLKE